MSKEKIDNLVEGLRILSRYSGDDEVVAEHGEIHAGPSLSEHNVISEEEEAILRALGWAIGEADRWMFRT